uniref:TOG domain-containing protein n=1 Tax=Ciona intestinalis TaxID=7719 RepID=H2XRN4_CIOIN
DENELLNMLLDEAHRTEALQYLDKQFHENNSILIFKDKHALFKGFSYALADIATNVRVQCTKLIAKIVSQLGSDLDVCMGRVLQKIITNVGNQHVSLQKESIQTLHLYMKHCVDVYPILSIIANHGIEHEDARTRQQIIHTFPTLLFPDFEHEDFFDVVSCLVNNLTQSYVDKDLLLKTLDKVKDFIGAHRFNGYINRLPEPMQETYLRAQEPNQFNKTTWDQGSTHLDSFGSSPVLKSSSELPFVPETVMNGILSNDPPQQVYAMKELISIIKELYDAQPLKENLRVLVSLLVPMIENHNQRISMCALDAIDSLIVRLGVDIRNSVKSICISVSKKFGTTKLPVKGKCMLLLTHAMEVTDPQLVLDYFLPLLHHKQARVRHDCINFIISSLLHFSLGRKHHRKLNIEKISASVAPLLVDSSKDVRRGTLECFAVIHKVHGSETSIGPISDAVNQVELSNDNATGLMSAMHARLFRKNLPRITENYLVEYPDFSTSTVPISSPQGADLQWVKAAVSENGRLEKHRNYAHSIEATSPEASATTTAPTRRFLSAGKQRFPWASPNEENSKHPSSAPVKIFNNFNIYMYCLKIIIVMIIPLVLLCQTQRDKDNQPPFQPRHTWGAESDIPTQVISASTQISQRNRMGQTDNQPNANNSGRFFKIYIYYIYLVLIYGSCPSYQELYMKKKNHTQKCNQSRTSTHSLRPSGANSTYKPSFAASGPVSPDPKADVRDASFLSASCPTTFFENSGPRHSNRRVQPKIAYGANDSTNNLNSTDSPIRLKPALARSASKRHFNDHNKSFPSGYTPSVLPDKPDGSGGKELFKYPKEKPAYRPSNLTQKNQKNRILFYINKQVQLSAIRRSAQNKLRQRMRSQPTDSENTNFSESATILLCFSSLTSNDYMETVSVKSEPPPFQYNPNMGVTFDPKKVDSTVSVVGVKLGYQQHAHGSNSSSSPATTPTATTPSSISGSNNAFNVQGRGVFMSPSSSSLLASTDNTEASSPTQFDNQAWSSSRGIFGRAVRNPSVSSEENNQQEAMNMGISDFSLSASLRQRQLEKNILHNNNTSFDLNISGTTKFSGLTKERVTKSSTSSGKMCLHAYIYVVNAFFSKAVLSLSSIKPANERLDNPEQSLLNAISVVESADSENWEAITDNIFIMRRMAKFHPAVLASKFHDVMLLLCKNVHNLRSQVSRASVVCISDIYENLKRPTVNGDIETCVKALLKEHGGANSFIQEEIMKALRSMIDSASSNKTLNALLNSGLRYHGRYIINALMYHGDFDKSLERFLSPKNAQEIKECAFTIKQRGLGTISSAGSRKVLSGSIRRSGSHPSSGQSKDRTSNFSNSSTSASLRRKTNSGTKMFNEQEAEEVSQLCSKISQGSLLDRKEAVNALIQKINSNRAFVEDNIIKIMDAYMTLLTTANTKFNSIGLGSLPDLISSLGDTIRDKLPVLVPAVLKLIASKQQSNQARVVVDVIVDKFDNLALIQPFASVSQYGSGKPRQVAITKLVELLENVPPKRVQHVERHVLPLLWSLLSPNAAPSGVQLRREIQSLAVALKQIIGSRLFDYAESQNLHRNLEGCLKSEL